MSVSESARALRPGRITALAGSNAPCIALFIVWTRRARHGLHESLLCASRQSPAGARARCSTFLNRAASLETLS